MELRKDNVLKKIFLENAKLVLTINIFLAALISSLFYQNFKKSETDSIKNSQLKLSRDFELAFNQYLHPLQGIRASIHLANFNFSSTDFRKSAESRDLFSNFKGTLGFGFIRKVPEKELVSYLRRQKKARPDFEIKRLADKESVDNFYIIEEIEPLEKNSKALGLVISDEVLRRNAATESMKTGNEALTMPVHLVQAQSTNIGFLYFLPIYKTATPPASESERISNIVGWAYTPLLAKNIIDFVQSQNPDIDISYIGIANENNHREAVFNSQNQIPPEQSFTVFSTVAGKQWVIISMQKNIDKWSVKMRAIFVFILLLFLPVLLYYYTQLAKNKLKFQDKVLKRTQEQVERATRKIQSQSQFLQKVIDSIPVLVGYWDKNLINQIANEKYYEFYDLKPDQIRGKHMKDVLGITYEKNKLYIAEVLKGIPQKFEREIQINSVTKNIITHYIPEFDIYNQVSGFFVLVFDISEIRSLQEKEKESQAQLYSQSKLSLLGEMAAGIAHEINNPLAIIKGKSQITTMLANSLPEDYQNKTAIIKNITLIDSTVDRIARIVKALVSLSRNAEDEPFEMIPIHDIISDIQEITQEKAKKSQISIIFPEQDKNIQCLCNKTQIEQVLLNLISNSLFAISNKDEKWIKVESIVTEEHIGFRVTDSGKGISPEILDKIMTPFFTTKGIGQGTGIGLSISKSIIEKHNGVLKYELKGENTSFVFLLNRSNSKTLKESA